MTINTFNILCKELQQIAKSIPLQWGQTQNDIADAQINMFAIANYSQLILAIHHLTADKQNYFKRRWFLWQCSKCDEFLFCQNENVTPNNNKRDKIYDIEFNKNNALQFDIKGTVIPKQFRTNAQAIIDNPVAMIHFFYEQQSKGVREGYQNRLFVVHHSFRQQEREMYLRCHFDFKKQLYAQYAQNVKTTSNFYQYQTAKADVVFIIENTDRIITSKIYSAINT